MRLRFAMVCASNQNRSMEAHAALLKEGFNVCSYGTGTNVKIPGPSQKEPNVYKFGTPYRQMYDELFKKDPELYKRNNILRMLKRNFAVKEAPQKWQDNAADGPFDVICAFEERVFDIVNEDLASRPQQGVPRLALVINLEVKDTHEDAAAAARFTIHLCRLLEECDDWEDEIEDIVIRFEEQTNQKLLYNVAFY